ncbi:unnamed protein product [Pleuronectes platessa]|uniref:Uncharacterized protein n=1 Tax=Pleuronectes platessa TaxID=8262 RepID=A0A9N7YYR0_PLEPL|nr:unnamed protein product [Pleuronectes platessa]
MAVGTKGEGKHVSLSARTGPMSLPIMPREKGEFICGCRCSTDLPTDLSREAAAKANKTLEHLCPQRRGGDHRAPRVAQVLMKTEKGKGKGRRRGRQMKERVLFPLRMQPVEKTGMCYKGRTVVQEWVKEGITVPGANLPESMRGEVCLICSHTSRAT